jgi:hypothetical protein
MRDQPIVRADGLGEDVDAGVDEVAMWLARKWLGRF